MTLSRTLAERGEHEEALKTYATVLQLKNPISAAEAQYRIGEVHEKIAKEATKDETSSKWTAAGISDKTALQEKMGAAIQAYTRTYQSYPESPFAAKALEKVARYYADTNDYARAADLFEKVMNDYPDAKFIDEILFLWAQLGIKMDNSALAKEKLNQLIFNYPSSVRAPEAKKMLAALK
jgi:TolA-binding protein